jgi:hypothetical protein
MKLILASLCVLLLVAESFGSKASPAAGGGKWPDPANDVYYDIVKKNQQRVRDGETISQHQLDENLLCENTVVVEGGTVTLTCGVAFPSLQHIIRWIEYASNPEGVPISDNEVIGFHPERERYEIVGENQYEFSLRIKDVRLSDGGAYQCLDALSIDVNEKQTHTCGLIVVAAAPNCTTTIGASNVVIRDSYQTNDCLLDYRGPIEPVMSWSGPGPFEQRQVATVDTIWSGMQYYVNLDMDTRNHQCTTFFEYNFGPQPPDQATNVPTYTQVHASRQHYVYWGPRNHTQTPVQQTYQVGDVLTCYADAWPPSSYLWQNLRTGVISVGNTLEIPSSYLGFNQSVRCEAANVIEGTNYVSNVFLAVDVPLPTTTPPPTTPTTTTQPPAVAPCRDLSGNWYSNDPTMATICVALDTDGLGHLTGLLKNATETFWIDLHGRAQADKFDQVGFNGIWPLNIGVSSFVGECHRCFGVEYMLVNVVSRSKGSPCGSSGDIRYTTQYRFNRSPVVTCPGYPSVPDI